MSTTAPAPANNSAAASPGSIVPQEARDLANRDEALLVDVREPYERASAYIPGSHPAPLSSFDPSALHRQFPERRIIFQCKAGSRSADAAHRYIQATGRAADTLEGGIDAWKAHGLDVARAAGAPRLDVMRQVQIAAGSGTFVGTLLGVFIHPTLLVIPVFIGAGLTFAGLTGWCGLAKLLALMPWNRAA